MSRYSLLRAGMVTGILAAHLLLTAAPITTDFRETGKFDGRTLARLPDSEGFAPTQAFTVEVEFRFADTDFENIPWVCLVDKAGTDATGMVLQYYFGLPSVLLHTTNGTFTVDRFTPDYRVFAPDREWHRLSATCDGRELKLYYDGQPVGKIRVSGTMKPNRLPVAVGGAGAIDNRFFTGTIGTVVLDDTTARTYQPIHPQEQTMNLLGTIPELGDGFSAAEDVDTITIGNPDATYVFTKNTTGIRLSGIRPTGVNRGFTAAENLSGGWSLEFSGPPPTGATGGTTAAELQRQGDALTLTLIRKGDFGTLEENYIVPRTGNYLTARAYYCNTTGNNRELEISRFDLSGIALDGSIADDRFLYPPHAFNFMHGKMSDATGSYMSSRYIYGNMMSTDKLMLPYAMIYQAEQPMSLTLAIAKTDAKNFVGVTGGEVGSLNSFSVIQRTIVPEQRIDLARVIVHFEFLGWQDSMRRQRDLLVREFDYHKFRRTSAPIDDLVILWDGFPGVGFDTFAGLAQRLPRYREIGFNALIIGGRVWYCYFDEKPESGVAGFIPLPQDDKVIPSPKTGGPAGLAELKAACVRNGMKLMAWGPVSMAGMDVHAVNATRTPEWFNRNADGSWSKWYQFMLPGNPGSPGWRNFYVTNVKRLLTEYDLDGLWFDSSWQDHQPNAMSTCGHRSENNANVYRLMTEIGTAVQQIKPDAILMGETGGAEAAQRLDLVYSQMHGIWPAIPADAVQDLVIAEELCRLPGARLFGQLEMGLGFYPELGDEARNYAQRYEYSWLAKTFLVSTSERTPVYFGFNWAVGNLLDDTPEVIAGTENNPERLLAIQNRQRFREWLDVLKQVNAIRTANPELRHGDTDFDAVSVSDKRIVHYVRSNGDRHSLVLLNADVEPVTAQVKLVRPEALGLAAGHRYNLIDLMSGKTIGSDIDPDNPDSRSFTITLNRYRGAILKAQPQD